MTRKKLVVNRLSAAIISVTSAMSVVAQESKNADDFFIEEVIVTAQKREQSLQDTPVAVTAITEAVIENTDINDVRDLQMLAPSVTFNEAPAGAQIYIRGVGQDDVNIGKSPGVAMYLDGVYLGHGFANAASFQDAAQFEVLRGPQGTLYGRNSTAGNINVRTKKPTFEPTAKVSVAAGTYNATQGSISGSMGIIEDKLAVRGSYLYKERDGYAKNLTNGDDVDTEQLSSAAASVLYLPNEDMEIIVRSDYQKRDINSRPSGRLENVTDGGKGGIPSAMFVGKGSRDVYGDITGKLSMEVWGASSSLVWDFNDMTLNALVSYRESKRDTSSDTDGTSLFLANIIYGEKAEEYTLDVNLSGTAFEENLEWIVGANYYYDDASSDADVPAVFGSVFVDIDYADELSSIGVFAQGTYHLTDRLRATAGLRYTRDERDTVLSKSTTFLASSTVITECENLKLSDSWETPTFKVGVDYDLSSDAMVYGSVSRGFKAGGINGTDCNQTFDEEVILAYEMGFKSTYFDRRLLVNGAFYFYDYTDMQVRTWDTGQALLENAGESEIYGAELEVVARPFEGFQMDANLSAQKAEFTDAEISNTLVLGDPNQDVSGNAMLRAPDLKLQVGLQHTFQFDSGDSLQLRYDVLYTDEYYSDAFEREVTRMDSNTLQNFRVTWRDSQEDWFAQVYVENLTDEEYFDWKLPSGTGGAAPTAGVLGSYAPPRTAGVRVSRTF
ncbi:TonB-dependent receptor [Maricurvus nonylphenolicus]|uniref:TonB-dependent receptor n=1 Tax=Maricurvus nonylphenolicus TaxID=1008307 RepID=UPI0036F254F5